MVDRAYRCHLACRHSPYGNPNGCAPRRECPDLFLLPGGLNGTTYLSKYSDAGDHYTTGTYDEAAAAFTPFPDFASEELAQPAMYDTNAEFYASKTFLDGRGGAGNRRVLWGWLRTAADPLSGKSWTGAQSLPREVRAGSDGRTVATYPIAEMESLRDEASALDLSGLVLANASAAVALPMASGAGRFLDIEATLSFEGTAAEQVFPDTDLPGGDYSVATS